MAHTCCICKKDIERKDLRHSHSVGVNYYFCPDCIKYIDAKDASISNLEKITKLSEIAWQYKKDAWFKNYIEGIIKDVKAAMSEEERKQADDIFINKRKEVLAEQRSVSAESFKNKIDTDIVLVTTDFVTGHTIKQMLGPVSGCSAIGAGIIKSAFASLSATFGTESDSFSNKITETRIGAEKAMLKEAKDLGANAVIDVHYAISNFAADITGILVSGTAVVIE